MRIQPKELHALILGSSFVLLQAKNLYLFLFLKRRVFTR